MDDTLILLANEVRAKTLWLLDGVTDEMAHFVAPGLANSILWHAGHALVVVEHLGVVPASGGPPVLPDGWFEKFSWDSQPRTISDWPRIPEVVLHLQMQLPRLVQAIAGLSPQRLEQLHDPGSDRSLRLEILHGLHDEANHQGEIWLLRKMFAKRAP